MSELLSNMELFSRDENEVYAPGHERVSQTTFMAVAWFFTAISLVFLSARLTIRFKAFHKLALDDLLAIAAWLMLLAYTITWQLKVGLMYWQFDIVSGKTTFTPEFLDAWATFMPFVVVWNVLLYCCLWSIKFSFLVFFRGLDTTVRLHRTWWWIVFGCTVAGLAASIGDIDYPCSLNSVMFIITECNRADHVQFQNRTLYANMAADIFTDMLILSIPIIILWKVQISLRRKLILYSIFSATIIIMIVAIIRTVLIKPNPKVKQGASLDWLYLWSVIEMGVAIMIACVASFRQLFISQGNQHLYGSKKGPSSSKRNLLQYLKSIAGRSSSRIGSDQGSMEEKQRHEFVPSKRGIQRTEEYTVSITGPNAV